MARAEERDGRVTVHQGGKRRLYGFLDQVRDHWLTYRGSIADWPIDASGSEQTVFKASEC